LHFRLTERGRILWLNLAAIGLLALMTAFFLGLLLLYHRLGAPLVITSLPSNISAWLGVALVIAVLPLHEWLHGLGMAYFGHQPRYGIKPLKGVLYATADGALFWRYQYIAIALAPLTVISAGVALLCLFLPGQPAFWVALAGIMNATGAIGDLWMTYLALQYPSSALFRDEEDGMRVFTQPS
jgi:hypothetical protein